jgi:mRNA interferase RelE/StbE
VRYRVVLSDRAAKDLDKLNRDTQQRILRRLEQLSAAPFDPRFSAPLKNAGELRKSRVGGWRIIFLVNEEEAILDVVTIERRGQVYQRI